jgi:hypothetical protein
MNKKIRLPIVLAGGTWAVEIWNALPLGIKFGESVQSFKRVLKTHLFNLLVNFEKKFRYVMF